MSYQKSKTSSYCIGSRHFAAEVSFEDDIAFNFLAVINENCAIFEKKMSMTLNDNTNKAEGLGSLFENMKNLRLKQV